MTSARQAANVVVDVALVPEERRRDLDVGHRRRPPVRRRPLHARARRSPPARRRGARAARAAPSRAGAPASVTAYPTLGPAGRAACRWAARRRGRRDGRPATPGRRAGARPAPGWAPGAGGRRARGRRTDRWAWVSATARRSVGQAVAEEQAVDQRVVQRLPRRLDDVLAHADGRPRALAVGGVEQHPGDGAGALVGVEHPHLVVGEVHRGRAPGTRSPSALRSAVSSALTGPLPSAVAIDALAVDVHLDGGLGGDAAAVRGERVVVVGDHPERLDLEPVAAPSRRPGASAARASRRRPRSGSPRARAA